jgi:hypothetical protein
MNERFREKRLEPKMINAQGRDRRKENRVFGQSLKGYEGMQKAFVHLLSRTVKRKALISDREAFVREILEWEHSNGKNRPISREELALIKLFSDFLEIYRALGRLDHVLFYLRQRPPTANWKRGLTKSDYIDYHIEKYFEEIYLLKNRWVSFVKRVQRFYRTSPPKIQANIRLGETLFMDVMNDLVSVRGCHVHERRLRFDDIVALATLEFLIHSAGLRGIYYTFYQQQFRKTKTNWINDVTYYNRTLKRLLDVCCDLVFPFIFSEENEIVLGKAELRK